jgi:hypothetical protein
VIARTNTCAFTLPGDIWLTSADVAKALRCSKGRVGALVRSGALGVDARGRGNRLMFRYSTVARFVENQNSQASARDP